MRKIDTINWQDIQNEYDTGVNTLFLIKKYKLSATLFRQASLRGLFKPRTKAENCKLYRIRNPNLKLSDETKLKISISRKAYLKEHPDQVPYLLNHRHKKKFYSEIYFGECFQGTDIIKEHQISLYSLDFADIDKKIDIEIDGDQHFVDKRIIKHDQKRNKFISSLGWTIIRVRWSEFQKLNYEEKSKIVQSIIKYKNPNHHCIAFIPPNTNINMVEYYANRTPICSCGQEKFVTSKKCRSCYTASKQKTPPNKNYLQQLLDAKTQHEIRKIFHISLKTLHKWIKLHELEIGPSEANCTPKS